MDYSRMDIKELGLPRKYDISCADSDLFTVGALVEASNNINHSPVVGLSYYGVREIVEAVEKAGINDINIYPVHLAWYYPISPIKTFDISTMPVDTEIDGLNIKSRIKNTLKLSDIYTFDDLERRFKNPSLPSIDYLLWDDIGVLVDVLDALGRDVDPYPDHLNWEDPEEDRTRFKISPNAPSEDNGVSILKLNSRYCNALENSGINTIGDILERYRIDNLYNIPGLGRGYEVVKKRMHDIGYYI